MRNKVEVKETGKYGKSLFAKQDFQKDEIVLRIEGNIVTTPTIYTIPIDFGKYIDDQRYGKCLCHSCEPNCGIKNRTEIVAMRDILVGEEITVDYAMFVPEYGNEITEEELVCHCGSKNCRGRLGAYNRLPDDIKKKYKGYISEYLLKSV